MSRTTTVSLVSILLLLLTSISITSAEEKLDDNPLASIANEVFADSAEAIAMTLSSLGLSYRPYERRLKSRRNQAETFVGFEFEHEHAIVQTTVFQIDGIRQAPISPINGKPMQRADADAVEALIAD